MKSLSGLYIGLGLVFGFLFLGIVAELYYLLWWKKRINNTTEVEKEEEEEDYNHHVKEPQHLISSKKPSFCDTKTQERTRDHGLDLELGYGRELLEDEEEEEEEEEDLELMGLYNLAGQPRFLFTIMEETKEDLESEDGKSRGERSRKGSRNRSLSDIIMAMETPFFTPMASPPLKGSSSSSPLNSLASYKNHGFNPLFESSSSLELELNRMRSSPPPKFKFLREAEEKLYRKLMEEAQKKADFKATVNEEREVRVNAKNQQRIKSLNQRFHYSSASNSQVLPLVSSPPEFESLDKKKLNNGFC